MIFSPKAASEKSRPWIIWRVSLKMNYSSQITEPLFNDVRKTGLALPAPLVSVLMPTYNVEPFLRLAVESILNQTFSDFEFLIIDNCSADGTYELLAEYAQRDKRIRLFRNEKNMGLIFSLNRGISLAHGQYIARMDADDISTPDRLEKQAEFFAQHPEVDLVCSKVGVFTGNPDEIMFERGAPAAHRQIYRLAKFRDPIDHGSVMVRTAAIRKAGGYAEKYAKKFEDYHLWVKMLSAGSQMACIPQVLYKLRRDDDALRRHRGPRFVALAIRLQIELWQMGFISLPRFLLNTLVRTTIYLLPFAMLKQLRKMLQL